MVQTTSRILKSSDVEVEGQFHLDAGPHVQSSQNGRNPGVAAPKVRILESQNEFAVVEVICSCGRKTVVRCEYGETAVTQNTQPGADTGNSSEKKL